MALKKSQLYSSLWQSCDELRGGMDASQYKDYVLTLLFMKYVSDKHASDPNALIDVSRGIPACIVIIDKEGAAIEADVQRLAARIREIEDRYARPLTELERDVETFSAKVDGHLADGTFSMSQIFDFENLLELCRQTHEETRHWAARAVDRSLVVRNWLFGWYIVEYEQYGADRAEYGTALIKSLAAKLGNWGYEAAPAGVWRYRASFTGAIRRFCRHRLQNWR